MAKNSLKSIFSAPERPKRLPIWIILVGFILFLSYLYIGGDYGLWQHYKLHQRTKQLSLEVERLRAEQDSLRHLIKRLRADSSYIAKVAREKYNMGYPDEEIIRVIHKEKQ